MSLLSSLWCFLLGLLRYYSVISLVLQISISGSLMLARTIAPCLPRWKSLIITEIFDPPLAWAWLECVAVTNPRTLTRAPDAFSEFVVLWEGAGNLAQGWQLPVSSFHLLFNWPLETPVAWSTAAGGWDGSRGGTPACWWSWCSWLVFVLLVLQFLFLLLNLLGTSPGTSIAKLLLVKPDF